MKSGGQHLASEWISYNELAWVEDWLVDPADYEEEVKVYVDLIRQKSSKTPKTLLHLGCGAGGYDRILKRYFTVTGVDLSRGMLDMARKANPDIEYIEEDMRTLRLDRQFDAVIIPDSIDYMASEEDVRKAILTVSVHLKMGGVFLIVAKPEETFQNNNFAYSGEKDGIHVTLLENNYINPFCPNTYEITLVYLIRKQGKLTTYTEHSAAGLFKQDTWVRLFTEAGFSVNKAKLDSLYDQYLLGDGAYLITIFFGQKIKNH